MAGAEGEVLTGAELEGLGPAALREAVRRSHVFARVSPAHKLALVEALREAGEIVAVTGDGVNDAPALRRADVGVAMGRRGSDVAREVSDLVLLDDNFASIVAAIREGREIYANIEKFIRFLFSTNAGELLLVLGGTLGAYALGMRDASGALLLPLTAAQILWVNFITDGPAALALGLDRNPDVMAAPPRPPGQPLLDGPSLRFVLLAGGAMAALAGVLLLGLPALGASLEATRTAVFLHTTLAPLAFAYPSRRFAGRPLPNPILHVTLALAASVQLGALLVPGLRDALGVVPLDAAEWVAVGSSVALSWAAAEATRSLVCRRSAAAVTSRTTASQSGGR
jgi:Ca2+-transporting ATPase